MIELMDIGRIFGTVRALDGVTLRIETGARLALLGASGSGKTTLLRLIAGLDLPDSGEISMDGRVVSRAGWALEPHRRGIGFVFQKPCLWPHMTVAQNVDFAIAGVPKAERRARLGAVLETTGLADLAGRYPSELSGGQERRVALARAMVGQPQILLMDEPLTSLDPEAKGEMLELVSRTVKQHSCTLVYVTHEKAEADALANETLLLQAGRLVSPQAEASQ
ncbi:ABC transporter substrate-binding protein [candidate division BRC1 bacterium HGW-BRC1-1]|jgi:ABC-type sulfate/molybdate transport systems ATPase subunit|nr:MAG: ABC transporter substrate-binding protein [candidate division BRC1 bacterium HGW-BRC1-1]